MATLSTKALIRRDLAALSRALEELSDFADSRWDGSVHEEAYEAMQAGTRASSALDRLRKRIAQSEGETA